MKRRPFTVSKSNYHTSAQYPYKNDPITTCLLHAFLEPELAEKHGEEIPTELHHARKRTAHQALVMAYLAEEARCGQGLGQRVCER